MVTLRPLTPAELKDYGDARVPTVTQDLIDNFRLPAPQATREAKHDAAQSLTSPGQTLIAIAMPEMPLIGHLWVSESPETQSARIVDFRVRPQHRGNGFGRAALAALEELLRPKGVTQIRLRVPANGPRARAFFESLGYFQTGTGMALPLPLPVATPHPAGTPKIVRLRPHGPIEFTAFLAAGIAAYADDLSAHHALSPDRAAAESRLSMANMYPEGQATPGEFSFAITDPDASLLGHLGFSVAPETATAFLSEIEILPSRRSQGHGTAALAALAAHLKPQGITQIRLRVAANNPRAKALYSAIGCFETGINLAKSL